MAQTFGVAGWFKDSRDFAIQQGQTASSRGYPRLGHNQEANPAKTEFNHVRLTDRDANERYDRYHWPQQTLPANQ